MPSSIKRCRRIQAGSRSPRAGHKNVVSRGRFFLSALCFLSFRLSLVAVLALTGYAIVTGGVSREMLYVICISVGLLVVTGLNVLANGRRVTCPLCRASLFMAQRNLVKPGVPKILGCSKTPLAFSLLTMPEVMRCPCCSEKVRLVRSQ